MSDLEETLKNLQIEDCIWIIYIFLSIMAILSNKFEREYTLHHQKKDYQAFHFLNLDNGIIIFFIYLYFLYRAYIRYKKEHGHVNLKKDILNDVSFITNIFFVLAGLATILAEIFSRTNEDMNLLG